MSAFALSRHLPDFSTHRIADDAVEIIATPASLRPLGAQAEPKTGAAAEKPASDEQAEIARMVALEEEKRLAFEAGREDGHREVEALYEAEKARLLREHEAEIETLRAAFSREQAVLLASALTEGLGALERSLSAQVAGILAPLLADKMQGEAVSEFVARIGALVLDGEAPEISGPAQLLQPLRDHADLLPPGCRFTETVSSELSFSFGERVLETRVAPLLDELRAAVQ
ncbi:hypothetical protein KUG47_12630 [Falsochrobactrum sp. TDYN1]|uniref:Uncharacterized protein n=1 Tax=Falsochrobactrum tianjinense TaxID=2706015 RepID=A0A949PQ27_9HYPH|nr:hypothetical protein [Falsochrobactrum sp. TDYN1]MBV2144340.1 hypothetical protein [Falsochrobactrum sp. TDYN1]